ncbi:hypothetical protein LTR15_008026 [Elasticomyces elasticus]|nr:hypothetical protein LTR15_008026 [Elasticomyces elasticus]
MAMAVEANDSGRTVSPLPSSSLLRSPRSPDTASHIYPERAIRPMPRSRLKSRLSPEQAQGITYPASPPLPSPRLASNGDTSYNERGPIVNGVRAVHAYAEHHIHGHHHHEDPHYPHHNHHRHQAEQQEVGHCTCGDHEGEIPDSGDEEVEFDHPDYRYTPAAGTPTPAGYPGHVHEMVAAREIAAMAGGKQPPPLDSVQRRLMEARLGGGNNGGGNGKILPPPGSTASSSAGGDGYESFENTSNKKKRKIPLSGASSTLHQSSLSAEMASMGISGQTDGAADDVGAVQQQSASYTSPGVAVGAGTGISGAGRGRYGRSGNVNAYRNGLRRPLTNGTVNMAGGAGELMNGDDTFETTTTTGGIISQAIKSAAEQGPLTPQKAGTNGKTLSPNQSLLHSATTSSSNSNTTTPKTQFTFHVDSESATKMADHEAAAANAAGTAYAQAAYAATAPQMPGSYPTGPVQLPGGRGAGGQYHNTPANNAGGGRSTQGTQTTPSLRGGAPANNPSRLPPPPATATATGQQQPQQQQQPPKPKTRRRPSKEYALAARQRQLQQEYSNYHHRPTKDSMWICEFCEYEDIFGTPPLALIRSYEVKDRKERKAKAERRRLLEKAKMKGRKNKKGGKKAGNAGGAPGNGGGGGTAPGPVNGEGGRGYDARVDGGVPPGEEEYYDDEVEYGEGSLEGEGDEYEPEGGEGEYEDAYYAPPAATAAVRGSTVHGGGGGHPQAQKQGGEVREGGRA